MLPNQRTLSQANIRSSVFRKMYILSIFYFYVTIYGSREGYEVSYTDEEIGLIDGLIRSYFMPPSVSAAVREEYFVTHQHITNNQVGYDDLVKIKEALSFLLSQFARDRQMEKELCLILIKTNMLMKSPCC